MRHHKPLMKAKKVEPVLGDEYPLLGGGENQTASSETDRLAFPTSSEVKTSCPSRRSSRTAWTGKFSLE